MCNIMIMTLNFAYGLLAGGSCPCTALFTHMLAWSDDFSSVMAEELQI